MLPRTVNLHNLSIAINEAIIHEQIVIGKHYEILKALEIYFQDFIDKSELKDLKSLVESFIKEEYTHSNQLMDLVEKLENIHSDREKSEIIKDLEKQIF